MKKKGFTLIELLAVIVVLAIIALIATPIVLNLIKTARIGAAEQSATAYVKAIENAVVKDMLKQIEHENKVGYQYDEISVDVSGTKPTSGTYTLKEINPVTAKVGLMRLGKMLAGQSFNKNEKYRFWTLNKYNNKDFIFTIHCIGSSITENIKYSYDIRPVIKVKNEIKVMGGNGTWNNPYEI